MPSPIIPYGIIQTIPALGKLLRAHRKARGWTQGRVAEFSGVGLRFISELENGNETAEIGKVLQVLKGLGLSFDLQPQALPLQKSSLDWLQNLEAYLAKNSK